MDSFGGCTTRTHATVDFPTGSHGNDLLAVFPRYKYAYWCFGDVTTKIPMCLLVFRGCHHQNTNVSTGVSGMSPPKYQCVYWCFGDVTTKISMCLLVFRRCHHLLHIRFIMHNLTAKVFQTLQPWCLNTVADK